MDKMNLMEKTYDDLIKTIWGIEAMVVEEPVDQHPPRAKQINSQPLYILIDCDTKEEN